MITDTLRMWSHILFWLSIGLPVLGAGAAIGRYYVDRRINQQVEFASRPRHLTVDQRSQLTSILSSSSVGPVGVFGIDGDFESISFANDICDALQGAGVPASPVHAMKVFGPAEPENGVKLLIQDETAAPEYTRVLLDALRQIALDPELKLYPQMDAGKLLILVGKKQ
jgi:hypothetical protein